MESETPPLCLTSTGGDSSIYVVFVYGLFYHVRRRHTNSFLLLLTARKEFFFMAVIKPIRPVNMAEKAAEYARRGVGGDPVTYTGQLRHLLLQKGGRSVRTPANIPGQ